MSNSFEIRDQFYLNGKSVKIISGALHYYRVVPEYWLDRLEKLKAMGCNTVETYVPWNLHEPRKGQFDFNGILDITRFLLIAQELGLMVIVRPSPYICGEWEFGGLPAWILQEPGMRFRMTNQAFLGCLQEYYERLLPMLAPLQVQEGGPIVMMQVENEYGAYGDDKEYLLSIEKIMRDCGITVPFVTSDGPWRDYLACGGLDTALPTANFGSKAKEQFAILSKYTNGRPNMCMEFWVGWFDAWGDKEHHVTAHENNAADLDAILSEGNVNIYMFHGGTNFGFTNGANYYGSISPDVTSYDYDAPLSEDGRITPKYLAFQKVISKYVELPIVNLSTKIEQKNYGVIKCDAKVSLFEALKDISTPVHTNCTLSMEALGQNFGYVLYSTTIPAEQLIDKLRLVGANDRAHIFLNDTLIATKYDKELLEEIPVAVVDTGKESKLDILVENMGRVNYGPFLEHQKKGIAGGVLLDLRYRMSWDNYSLPLDNIDAVDFTKGYVAGMPAFYRFTFEAVECADTYLDFEGFGKGCAFINGFNLGRYWEVGPQKRLYVPGPLIKTGKNVIILFETEGKAGDSILLADEHKLQ